MVEWNRKPTSDDGTTQVRGGIDETHEPGALGTIVGDSELMFVPDLGTVDDRLVL